MEPVEKMLSIHLTDKCNNRCKFCVVDSPTQEKERVSRPLVEAFLKENAGKDFYAVNLHGGESTTRQDFFEILDLIQHHGYQQTILQTNARRLADEAFAKKVCDKGVTLFVVSLHGKDAETHDLITQVEGSFEAAVQGVRNVKKLGAGVRTNTVVSRLNKGQLSEIVDLLLDLKVDHINISALHPAGMAYRNFEEVAPTYDETRDEVKEAVDKIQQHDVRLTIEGFPYCTIPGMEHLIVEEYFKMLFRSHVFEDYENFMDKQTRTMGGPCNTCDSAKICGGVYKEYIEKRGWEEFGYR